MTSEVWQFLGFVAVVAVAVLLWLFVVYLPARTMENWNGRGGRDGEVSRAGSEEDSGGERDVSVGGGGARR